MECVRVTKGDDLMWVFRVLVELAYEGAITEEEKITVGMQMEVADDQQQ
jgi:hypothetical protein